MSRSQFPVRPNPSNPLPMSHPADPRRRTEPREARAAPLKVKMEFKHTFQEYLKLALSKVIPQAGVIIDPQEAVIFGLKEDCRQLTNKVQRELRSHQFKKVELKCQHDLDELEYELDSKFDARIFRSIYIEKALDTLSLYGCFENQCAKFRDILRKKVIVIVRINAEFGQEFMHSLERILRKGATSQLKHQHPHPHQQQPKKYVPASRGSPVRMGQQEEEYEEVVEDEVNYYQLKEKQAGEGGQMAAEVSQCMSESSFSWTKTESSMVSEQDDLGIFPIHEESHFSCA